MIGLEIKKKQYDINREAAKNQHYRQVKLINRNILQLKKYYFLVRIK